MIKRDDYYMVFPDGEEGKRKMAEAREKAMPVVPEDFIHLQFEGLYRELTGQGQQIIMVTESQYKQRIEENIAKSTAKPFQTPAEQLGKFFEPLINKIELFYNEVLRESGMDIKAVEIKEGDNFNDRNTVH